jgi:hypothetical protein
VRTIEIEVVRVEDFGEFEDRLGHDGSVVLVLFSVSTRWLRFGNNQTSGIVEPSTLKY